MFPNFFRLKPPYKQWKIKKCAISKIVKHTCANICHTECTSAIGFPKIKTLRFDSKNVYSILLFWINL